MFSGQGGQNPFGSPPTQSPGSSMLAGTSTTSSSVPPQSQPASSLFSGTSAWPSSSAAEEQGLLAMPRRRKGRLLWEFVYICLVFVCMIRDPRSGSQSGNFDQNLWILISRFIGSLLFCIHRYEILQHRVPPQYSLHRNPDSLRRQEASLACPRFHWRRRRPQLRRRRLLTPSKQQRQRQ